MHLRCLDCERFLINPCAVTGFGLPLTWSFKTLAAVDLWEDTAGFVLTLPVVVASATVALATSRCWRAGCGGEEWDAIFRGEFIPPLAIALVSGCIEGVGEDRGAAPCRGEVFPIWRWPPLPVLFATLMRFGRGWGGEWALSGAPSFPLAVRLPNDRVIMGVMGDEAGLPPVLAWFTWGWPPLPVLFTNLMRFGRGWGGEWATLDAPSFPLALPLPNDRLIMGVGAGLRPVLAWFTWVKEASELLIGREEAPAFVTRGEFERFSVFVTPEGALIQ